MALANLSGSGSPHIAHAIAATQPMIVQLKKKLRKYIQGSFLHFRFSAITMGIAARITPVIQRKVRIPNSCLPLIVELIGSE
jgi:hypothetical protein